MKTGMVILLAALNACNYNYVKSKAGDSGFQVSKEAAANPDFQTVMNAVIAPRCLSCHSNLGGNKGSLNLETFAALRAKAGAIEYRAVTVRNMPAGGLGADATALLKTWFDNGAPETIVGIGEKPDPSLGAGPDNWEKVSGILQKRCTTCHSPPTPEASLDLSQYNAVRAAVVAILKRTIVDRDMPPSAMTALTKTERDVLLNWANNQMPRN